MKVLITGSYGQLGTSLQRQLGKSIMTVFPMSHEQLDITNQGQAHRVLKEIKPDVVVHCAAYNKVDLAEKQVEICRRINVDGTRNIAEACAEISAYLIYTSSDYVFDGKKDSPYEVADVKCPLSIYGKSKSDGEEAVLNCNSQNAVLRISWLFGPSEKNFVKAILRAAQNKREIEVVSDQIGSPTYTEDLAILIDQMLRCQPSGIYHATNEGDCSRSEFAKEILTLAKSQTKVCEVQTKDNPEKAVRPRNSVLSKSSLDNVGLLRLPDWKDALSRYLAEQF